MKKYLFLLLLFLPTLRLFASDYYKIKAYIKSFDDSTAVSYAHIIIKQSNYFLVADDFGYFEENFRSEDTLIIMALGFVIKEIPVKDLSYIIVNKIYLQTRFYEIPEAVIFPYKTYDEFKQAFINLKLPKEKEIELDLPVFEKSKPSYITNINGQPTFVIEGPITALYMAFSREGKFLRRYQEIVKNDELKKEVKKRYNNDLITYITGIKDEKILSDFIQFCHLSDEFILKANEYDLYLAINQCYIEFKKANQSNPYKN
jgi:hypothetical protein